MFPGVGVRPDRNDFAQINEAHVGVEMAAHGVSVVEIALEGGKWRSVARQQVQPPDYRGYAK